MALPNNLITGVTAKLPGIPGDWKKQAAQSRATRMATARADAMLRHGATTLFCNWPSYRRAMWRSSLVVGFMAVR